MVESNEALQYHAQSPAGKISVQPTKPCLTQHDLSLAYTPGVALPCLEIAKDPSKVFDYTARGNLVAVITNGTAVLGLGNIGPAAGKPVMEGKGVLFKRFAGIDVFDIELDAPDVESFCAAVKAMAPTFGGINLEDVKAPECFEIEARLRKELDIPVFHDDQHGTAIISCAGMLNALLLTGRKPETTKVVFSGAGAAAIATADLMCALGFVKSNITLVDSMGVVRQGDPALAANANKARYAQATSARTLAEALVGADVFVGVSIKGVVSREMLKPMAARPIVFALANPDPEIPYPEARAARPDAIVATGRSDFPNQVNNVLGFPFIFRGALDTRARCVNMPMMIAAVNALSELAREDVDESVSKAYGGVKLAFGPEYIIPKPFDGRVLLRVAPAVALAASLSGVARKPITDVDAYAARLEKLLGKEREVMRFAVNRAKVYPRRVVFADGEEEKVLRAAERVLAEGIAQPILVGRTDVIRERCELLGLDLGLAEGRVTTFDSYQTPHSEELAQKLFQRRCRKGMTLQDARRLLRTRNWFAPMLVQEGYADGMVAGLGGSFPETLRPALRVIGPAPDVHRVAGVHLMVIKDETFLFADTTLTLDPTAEQMAEIACLTADLAKNFDLQPRIAMLSFSNFGSVPDGRSEKVQRATELVRTWRPDLQVEGEMHADIALLPEAANALYPFSRITGKANVLIFPSLEAGNIAQKVAQCAGAQATVGPILVGLGRPVNILSPYASVNEIVLATAITAMLASTRAKGEPAEPEGHDLLRLARQVRERSFGPGAVDPTPAAKTRTDS